MAESPGTQSNVGTERPDSDVVFRVEGANVNFGMGRGQSNVLHDVSLDIYRGETLGIVGESGSGKSMFASALLDAVVDPGVLTGNITYYPRSGEPIDLLSLSDSELRRVRWEEVSMVFQGAMSAFNPTMNMEEHFEETLEAHDYDVDDGISRAKTMLRDLHLEPGRILRSFPHELSGGQKQRALIALSLILEPEVVVMDEPTAALDLLMQRSILNLLYNIKDKYDLTIVFISHDLPIVSGFADRLAVMYAFEFVETGPAREVLRDPAHPYTRSLLKSTPNLETPYDEMVPIEGESPDPVNHPSGCSYHPRCPIADEQCSHEVPDYHRVSAAHQAACFHWEKSADAIPLSLGSGSEDA